MPVRATTPWSPVSTTILLFPAMLPAARLDCFRFWLAHRDGAQPPLKRRIDPVEMRLRILPYLFIYESIGVPFRCRLAGTAIVNAFKEDPTGRFLDKLVPRAALKSRNRLFAGVIELEVSVVYGVKLAWAE